MNHDANIHGTDGDTPKGAAVYESQHVQRSGSAESIIRNRRTINPNWTEPLPGMDDTGSGVLVGIEVKAGATVNAGDFKGLRKLAEACGDNFKLGGVLYDRGRPVTFGDRLVAAPRSCLWA
jgi:hypothetical protein